MTRASEGTQQQRSAEAAREAKIRDLMLAVAQGWYHVPDEPLAAAILKRTPAKAFLEAAPHTPAGP
jgi:hypothetical protein